MAAVTSRSLPAQVALHDLLAELRAYVPANPREAQMRDRVVAFLATDGLAAFERTNAGGHITASAWIVDPPRTHVVLLDHRKLGRWLQLGGHVDGDVDVRCAALREAREESGLRSLHALGETIYDVDVHRIPARGCEVEHDHYDLRFALEADPREPLVRNDEAHDLRWIALIDIEQYAIDDSVRRLVRKTSTL